MTLALIAGSDCVPDFPRATTESSLGVIERELDEVARC
jgi:hypothetical protein